MIVYPVYFLKETSTESIITLEYQVSIVLATSCLIDEAVASLAGSNNNLYKLLPKSG